MITSEKENAIKSKTQTEQEIIKDCVSHNHQVARELAIAGIAVFPCSPELNKKKLPRYNTPEKSPLKGVYWSREATTNLTIIDGWWRRKPDALVGIPAKQAALFIVDADRHPNEPDGVSAFEALVNQNDGLPEGVITVQTLFDGRHYYFRQKEGLTLGNSTGNLPDSVDTRGASGDGGYVIAPGTEWRSPTGEILRWREEEGSKKLIEAHESKTIPPVPDWLINIVNQTKTKKTISANLTSEQPHKIRQETSSNQVFDSPQEDAEKNATAKDGLSFAEWLDHEQVIEDMALFEKMMPYLDAHSRQNWLEKGFALYERFEEKGRSLWDRLSMRYPDKFDAIDQERTWQDIKKRARDRSSFDANKNLTFASLIYEARKNGYLDSTYTQADVRITSGTIQLPDSVADQEPDLVSFSSEVKKRKESGHGFRFWIHGYLPPPPANDLIQGFVAHGGYTIIAGQSQAGKSFTTIEAGVCIASGVDFFGHRIAKRCGVIFLLGEGYYTFHSRLFATVAKHGLADQRLPIAAIGDVEDLTTKAGLSDAQAKIRYAAEIIKKEHDVEVGAIFVDTVMSCCAIKNENDAGEMAAVARALNNLRLSPDTAVIGVFHHGKDPFAGVRGSTATNAAADNVLVLACDRDGGVARNRRLILTKSRNGPEGETIHLDLEPVEIVIGFDEIRTARLVKTHTDGPSRAPQAFKYSGSVKKLKYAIEQCLIDGGQEKRFWADAPIVRAARKSAVREVFRAGYDANGDTTLNREKNKDQAFRRALDQARDKKLIQYYEDGSGEWLWFLKDGS